MRSPSLPCHHLSTGIQTDHTTEFPFCFPYVMHRSAGQDLGCRLADIGMELSQMVQGAVVGALQWHMEEYLTGAMSPDLTLDRKALMVVCIERLLVLVKSLVNTLSGEC